MRLASLKTRQEFLRLRGGYRHATPAFVIETKPRMPADRAGPRFGFTVTKKLGNAVLRNRIRRRLRALVRGCPSVSSLPDFDYVVIARAAAAEREFADLAKDLEHALRRVHHLARETRNRST